MERVTGLGGVFFKAADPKALVQWYVTHLGIETDADGYVTFKWGQNAPVGLGGAEVQGSTVWNPFAATTTYFAPSPKEFMLNYRVRDMAAMITQLRAAGIEVSDAKDEPGFGLFAWLMDPEENRIELWQPPEGM